MMIQCRVYLCATYILLHFLYIYFVCVDVVHVVVFFYPFFCFKMCVVVVFLSDEMLAVVVENSVYAWI